MDNCRKRKQKEIIIPGLVKDQYQQKRVFANASDGSMVPVSSIIPLKFYMYISHWYTRLLLEILTVVIPAYCEAMVHMVAYTSNAIHYSSRRFEITGFQCRNA